MMAAALYLTNSNQWTMERGDVKIRPSVRSDMKRLKDRLRKSDVDEIYAFTGMRPHEAIVFSHDVSTCCQTVLLHGVPVAMFGTAPVRNDEKKAGVWFIATDELNMMKPSFLRMSKACIKTMLDIYPYLFNYVDARNTDSIKWLKWCGAELDEAKPIGYENKPFHFFTIQRRIYV